MKFLRFFNLLFAFGDLLFVLTQKVGKKVKGRYKNDKDLRWRLSPGAIKHLLLTIVILDFVHSWQMRIAQCLPRTNPLLDL